MLTSVAGLFAERHQSGSPAASPGIIALHGWGRGRRDWDQVLGGLDALAVDLPGFGQTPPPATEWSVAEYARALDPLLDAAHPAVLVGHSFGGRVAVRMAQARPDVVRALVLTGVPLLRPQGGPVSRPKRGYALVRALHRRGLVPASVMERARQKYGSDDYRRAQGVLRGVLVKAVNEEYRDALAAIAAARVPVRYVWGEADPVVPLAVAAEARAITGGELTAVPGSGHLIDAPLAAALRRAIEEVS